METFAGSGQDYLQAPALLVTSRHSGDPLAVEQSVAAVQGYKTMSARDLAVVQRELGILQGRLAEVEQQLGMERKMSEAANLLGKLHTGSSADKRKSLFKPNSKRLSKQADDEARVSQERMARLQFAQNELQARKVGLENRLLRHHAAVLAKSLGGEPLEHRPLSVAFGTPERSPRRMSRRMSSFDFDVDFPSMIPGSSGSSSGAPQIPPMHSNHSRSASLASNFEDPSAELALLAKKIEGALPSITPNPNKSTFIQSAFDWLLREQQSQQQQIDTLQDQARAADERVQHLAREQAKAKTTPADAQLEAQRAQLAATLDAEQRRGRELRDRLEAQRAELLEVTKELEDVTRIAVQSESQLTGLRGVVDHLEAQVRQQSEELASRRAASLTSSNPSVLCKEFRQIIHELCQQHYTAEREARAVGPVGQGQGAGQGSQGVGLGVSTRSSMGSVSSRATSRASRASRASIEIQTGPRTSSASANGSHPNGTSKRQSQTPYNPYGPSQHSDLDL